MDERIISFFEANSNKLNFTLEELIAKLGIRGEKNLKKFKKCLDRLVVSAVLYYDYRDKTYILFKNTSIHKGVLSFDKKKKYYVLDGDTRYYLNSNNLHNASYGDFVLVDFNYKKHGYEVTKVLRRDERKYVATVCYNDGVLCAYEEKLGYLEIVNGEDYAPGSIVLIDRDFERAKVLEVICHMDDPNARILKIVYRHGFSNVFSNEVKKQLVNIPSFLDSDLIERELSLGMVDMRDKDIVTIDCDDTKDMDDGVYVSKNADGTISLYVLIASVGYFVKDGDPLSVRIKEKGTSVYTPGGAIHLLPGKLSKGICSLNPDVDRFAICFKSTFDSNGNTVDFDIFRAVINSKLKMSYGAVDEILEKDNMVSGYEKYYKQLLMFEKLYLLIQNNFIKNGFLEFLSSELNLDIDENGMITDIKNYKQGTGAKIIEFLMLITNKNACEYFDNLGIPLIYRVDEEPNYKKISEIVKMLQDKKYLDNSIKVCDEENGKEEYSKEEIQHILKEVSKIRYPEVFHKMLIRAMSKAKYSAVNTGHYPLGLEHYAQFTSPIRRGGDWRNHTILNYYLDSGKDVQATIRRFPVNSLMKEADVYSEREREAEACENEVTQMLLVEYIDRHLDEINSEELIGRVSDIGFNVRVLLDKGISGKLVFPDSCRISNNNVFYNGRVICSIGDLVSVKIEGGKYKNGDVFLALVKNLDKEYGLDGEKKSEEKVKIRKYIPHN